PDVRRRRWNGGHELGGRAGPRLGAGRLLGPPLAPGRLRRGRSIGPLGRAAGRAGPGRPRSPPPLRDRTGGPRPGTVAPAPPSRADLRRMRRPLPPPHPKGRPQREPVRPYAEPPSAGTESAPNPSRKESPRNGIRRN